MKALSIAALFMLALANFVSAAESALFSGDLLTLSDGRRFRSFEIRRQTGTTVTVLHSGGVAAIPKRLLPPDVLLKFPIDPVAAEAEAKAAEESEAAGNRLRAQVAAEKEAAIQKRKAQTEAKQKVIDEIAAAKTKEALIAAAKDPDGEKAKEAKLAADVVRIEKLLRAEAKKFYEARNRTATSGQSYTFQCDVAFEDLREIPGYPGEYEIKGSVSYQYIYNRGGISPSGGNAKFTARVTTKGAYPGSAKLLDFRDHL